MFGRVTLSATQAIPLLKFVQFGTIWGAVQTSQGALAHDRDWYYDSSGQILYVYSAGGNPVTSFGSVSPIILSGQSLINLNGVSYVEIQHIQMDWYDSYGVQVQGTSDHVWLANMLADSQVPNGATPIGFYVHPAGTPGDIHLPANTDSHRNYKGYQFGRDADSGGVEELPGLCEPDLRAGGQHSGGDVLLLPFLCEQSGDGNFHRCDGDAGTD